MPQLGIKPTTLAYLDNVLTNWASWPVPHSHFLKSTITLAFKTRILYINDILGQITLLSGIVLCVVECIKASLVFYLWHTNSTPALLSNYDKWKCLWNAKCALSSGKDIPSWESLLYSILSILKPQCQNVGRIFCFSFLRKIEEIWWPRKI